VHSPPPRLLDHLPIRQFAVPFAKMKWSTLATAAIVPLASAHGFTHAEYASGEVMDLMMSSKEAAWAKQREAGNYDSQKWIDFHKKRANKDKIECKNGRVEAVKGDADQTYKVSR
jgi:uncharacterized protein involved in copper resistance